jgi:hypothetical protein
MAAEPTPRDARLDELDERVTKQGLQIIQLAVIIEDLAGGLFAIASQVNLVMPPGHKFEAEAYATLAAKAKIFADAIQGKSIESALVVPHHTTRPQG